jgi:hypothetical protein
MNKSNSTEFEFIERSNLNSNSIVKMWVFFEDLPSSIKLKADITEISDLNNFKYILKVKFKELEYVKPQNIIFLDYNNSQLLPGVNLQTLAKKVTAEKPLVVRYKMSNLSSE